MQGRILGLEPDGGVILSEDGARYPFRRADWKGAGEPAAGVKVDFEAGPEGARGVYPLQTGQSIDLGALGVRAQQTIELGAASPAGARALALLKGDLKVQLSLVLLAASLFLHLVVLGGPAGEMIRAALPGGGKYTLVGVGAAIDLADRGVSTATQGMDMATRYIGRSSMDLYGGRNPYAAQEAAELQKAKDKSNGLKAGAAMLRLAYLVYLVPLGAILLLVQAFRGQPTGLIALSLGVLSVLGFVGVLVVKAEAGAMLDSMGAGIAPADMTANFVQPGLGAYVILLAGLTLAAAAVGLLRLPKPAAVARV